MTTTHTADPLASIKIASPCTADWNRMQGDARKRFCGECRLHVHDLSAMTKDEALELLAAAGQGRLCVRLHRRSDGKVLTQDCPKGLRRRLRWAWARAAAMVSVLVSGFGCSRKAPAGGEGQVTPTMGSPVPPPALMGEALVEMGDMAAPMQQLQPQPEVLMGRVRMPDQPVQKPQAPR